MVDYKTLVFPVNWNTLNPNLISAIRFKVFLICYTRANLNPAPKVHDFSFLGKIFSEVIIYHESEARFLLSNDSPKTSSEQNIEICFKRSGMNQYVIETPLLVPVLQDIGSISRLLR